MLSLGLRDYQEVGLNNLAVGFFATPDKAAWRQLGVLPTGCHAKGQGILLYDGRIVNVEDIAVGDMLMGPDSQPRQVLALARGRQQMAVIQPVKGTAWTVNMDHVMTLVRTKQGGPSPSEQGGEVIDVRLSEYVEWSKWKKHIHKLFRVSVDFERSGNSTSTALPIDPYFLGALLGDGSIQKFVALHTTDVELIIECYREARRRPDMNIVRIASDGRKCPSIFLGHTSEDKGTRTPTSLTTALQDLSLFGTTCDDKFIPYIYKTATREDRLAVLAGLMDTDGSLTCGGYDFISKSRRLADDTAFVARSLGLAAYVAPCEKTCQTGATGTYFRVGISGDCSLLPTRLSRKQPTKRRQKKDHLRTGFTVVPTGGEADYYGFTLDGDGRYLLDDFTVTHNTGKTVIAAALPHQRAFQEWLARFPREDRKILFIAHRDELLTQAKDKIEHYNPQLRVEIEQADAYASPDADVVVASIQTLGARQGKRIARLEKSQFRIIIIDEAHHATADSYVAVLQYFDLLPPDDYMPKNQPMDVVESLRHQRQRLESWDKRDVIRDRLLLGITATSQRGDRIGLEAVFQKIGFQEHMLDMIKRKYLARLKGIRILTDTNLDDIKVRAGDLAQEELAERINTRERNLKIVKAWQQYAPERKTVVFCANIAQVDDLTATALENGIKAVGISGLMLRDERRQILKDFTAGKYEWLVNCNILTEGFDEPSITCVVMARPTKSALLYIQMAGRGTRLFPGKDDCLIMDIVDVTARHRLMTAPTLVGLPTNFDPAGADLVDLADKIEELKADNPLLDVEELAATDVRSIHDIEVHAEEIDLFEPFENPEMVENTSMAWMKTGDRYQIDYSGPMTNETVSLKQNQLGQWETVIEEFGETSPIGTPTVDLHGAFEKAEEWIRVNRFGVSLSLPRNAAWRTMQPSALQINALKRLKVKVKLTALTAGKASNLISLYKNRRKRT
jgi:superfamily II DNA or RNA helicase